MYEDTIEPTEDVSTEPAEESTPVTPSIDLTEEDAESLGIGGCMPGDTVTFTANVSEGENGAMRYDIVSATKEGEPDGDEAPESAGTIGGISLPPTKSKSLSPKAAGF